MTSKRHQPEIVRQPARGEPIYSSDAERPPLDWGGEDPDPVWEKLYYRGSVDPPYRSGRDRKKLMASMIANWEPIGKPFTNEELMCALGRCRCERCA